MKFRVDEMTTAQKRELWSCLDNQKKKPTPTDDELSRCINKMMSSHLCRSANAWGYVKRMLTPELRGFLDKSPVCDWLTVRRSEKILLYYIVDSVDKRNQTKVDRHFLYRIIIAIFPLYRETTYTHMLFNLRKHGFITKSDAEKGKKPFFVVGSFGRFYLEQKKEEIKRLVEEHDPAMQARKGGKRGIPWMRRRPELDKPKKQR